MILPTKLGYQFQYNQGTDWIREVTLPDPDGGGYGNPAYVAATGRDIAGRVIFETSTGRDGNLASQQTITAYIRDIRGLVTQVRQNPITAAGNGTFVTTAFAYDPLGRVSSTTDALGRVTDYVYDDAYQIAKRFDPVQDGSRNLTKSMYDLNGNLIAVWAPTGARTRYSYNSQGWMDSEIDPYGKTIDYDYDAAGNLVSRFDRYLRTNTGKYAEREYTYDGLDRLIGESWRSNSTTTPIFHRVEYTYDAAGNLDLVKEAHSGATPVVQYDYDYDLLGRITQIKDTAPATAIQNGTAIPQVPVMLNYTYDYRGGLSRSSINIQKAGATTSVEDHQNNYYYDNLGRITTITQNRYNNNGTAINERKDVTFGYNARGDVAQIKRLYRPSGGATASVAKTTLNYAFGGALEWMQTKVGIQDAELNAYSWGYDAIGRVTSFNAPEGKLEYTYDSTDQLVSSKFTSSGWNGPAPASETFSYDKNGNRVSADNKYETLSGSASSDRLIEDSEFQYTYDAEGNTTLVTVKSDSDPLTTDDGSKRISSWDLRNRLVRVEEQAPDGSVTKRVDYAYDAYNRRVLKQVDTAPIGSIDRTERYVWDRDQVTVVLDANGTTTRRIFNGPEIDQVFAEQDASGKVLWYVLDNQNTVRDVINSDGSLHNHLAYSAFGEIVAETDASRTPFFAYTGREWDEDIERQYSRHRWYDPEKGRFESEDPRRIGAGDTNYYRYVGNNPTNYTDPSGFAGEKNGPRSGITYKVSPEDLARWRMRLPGTGGTGGNSGPPPGWTAGPGGFLIMPNGDLLFIPPRPTASRLPGQPLVVGMSAPGYRQPPLAPLGIPRSITQRFMLETLGSSLGSGAIPPGGAVGPQQTYCSAYRSTYSQPTRATLLAGSRPSARADDISPQGGFIQYGAFDELGRPTMMRARITPDMIGTGSPASRNIQPPGFISGRGSNRARGHLLGDQLGGSGTEPRNLVTLQQNPANTPVMRDFETAVRRAVERGEIVDYTVAPNYDFTARIPRGLTLQARGSGGFRLDVTVLNPPGMQ